MKTLKVMIAVLVTMSAVPALAKTGENRDYEGKATHCMSALANAAKEKPALSTSSLNRDDKRVIRAGRG